MNNKTQLNFQMNNSDGQSNNSERGARLANLFTQAQGKFDDATEQCHYSFLPDMYSIWPYPPYFSPVASTPGFSMMPTPYVAPIPTQYPTAAIPTASGQQQQHIRNSACGGEPIPMLIQIGVQCVNQNNPLNINSLNDINSPVSKTTTNIINNNISEHQESSSTQSKSEENMSHSSSNSTSFIEKCNSIESLIKETEKKLG